MVVAVCNVFYAAVCVNCMQVCTVMLNQLNIIRGLLVVV